MVFEWDAESDWADKIWQTLADEYNRKFNSLPALDGHVAAILRMLRPLIVSVDRVCAIPFWASLPNSGYFISDHASPFLEHFQFSKDDIDGDAA